MNHWPDNTWRHFELGEGLIASGVDGLFRCWQASTDVLGKLYTGADRWHTVLRQMQAPVNLADILRRRTST